MNLFISPVTSFLGKILDHSFASRWSGACTGWYKSLAIQHAIADSTIALAYFIIPILLYFIRRTRKDIPFNGFLLSFELFILSCGVSHSISAITIFLPLYYLELTAKYLTAISSIIAAIILLRIHPILSTLPNPVTTQASLVKAEEKIETVQSANQLLEDFALLVAHDLQDPLKKNKVYLRLIQEGKDQFLEEMIANNERMDQLVNQMLTFARSGGIRIHREKVDIGNAINQALENLDVILEESDSIIIVDEMPEVIGDPIQLTRVFQNLIKNAIRHRSPNRPMRIEIQAQLINQIWNFSVCDNGEGINPEVIPTLFVPYKGKKQDSSGIGLGLAICKRIISSHYGEISITSQPDHGTCVHFTLNHPGE